MSRGVKVQKRKGARARAKAAGAGKAEEPMVACRFTWTLEDAAAVTLAREAAGLTKKALAALAGVSPARIYEVEKCYPGRGPNASLRARIAEALARAQKPRARRAGRPKPHLVAEAALAEPAQGFCPTEDEMDEEARLAAEAGKAAPDA
jgi:transcriptional regulator with XRE-family HTH domain